MAARKKMTLPQQYSTLMEAKKMVNRAKEMARRRPNDPDIEVILKSANVLLAQLLEEDDVMFLEYAHELGAKVKEPEYPHSIKTWYEDEFLELLENYGNKQ